jgi:hypothetical protein
MKTNAPEPCDKCENFRHADVYGDGRMISWCAVTSDDNVGNRDCLYFSEIYRGPIFDDD